MFERGEDSGDTPGEFQLWVEREHLDQVLPLAAGYHHLRLNKDGVLGILTRVGTAKAAASVDGKLGTDPRFDLSKALLAGGRHRRRRLRRDRCRSDPQFGRIASLMATSPSRSTRAIFRPIGRPAMCRYENPGLTNNRCAVRWKANSTH